MSAHPRLREKLIGHETIEQSFFRGFNSGRLHHALLINGDYGIGKATFAYRVTKFLLSYPDVNRGSLAIDQQSTTALLVNNLTHPDLMVIEDEQISVDNTREIGKFLSLRAVRGKYRVIIIDSVDNMNLNAANALLKLLEEPPENVIFFLICHDKQAILPTILSRCSMLRLSRLSFSNFCELIKEQIIEKLEETELKRLYNFSNHSLGRALTMHEEDFFSLYEDVQSLLEQKSYDKVKRLIGLAKSDQKWNMISYAIMAVFREKLQQQALAGTINDSHLDFVEKVKNYLDDVNLVHISRAHVLSAIFG